MDGPSQAPGTVIGEVNRRWPADPAAVISERHWSPGRPASLIPLHGPHCQTPVPGPSPITARSHRYIHQQCCALRRPFPANPLSQAIPSTWISTSPPGRRRRCPFL